VPGDGGALAGGRLNLEAACIVICSVARPAAGDKEATQYEIARASIPASKPAPAYEPIPGDATILGLRCLPLLFSVVRPNQATAGGVAAACAVTGPAWCLNRL
jgi:hypothetical protein